MARLLDDLLDVSRVIHGKIHLRTEVVDLRAAAEEAIHVVKPLADGCGHVLELQLPDQPVYVEGDSARLLQVQENLLENAVKYTAAGGRIGLALREQDGMAVLCVADNGMGIAPEMRDRILDLFVQTPKGPGRIDAGMGIGLTLVQSIVRLHGGQIAVRSEGVGRGSEFEVRLPLTEKRPEKAETLTPERDVGVRVLIVEDNPDSRELLESLLKLDGYEATSAPDGLRGLEAIAAQQPDVALVDIEMPGIDGLEVARKVCNELNDRSIRLVALTGYGAALHKASRRS